MRKEFMRFTNLYIKNSHYERLEQLNVIFRKGESYLLWGNDHTGHVFTDIFRGEARITSGQIWLNDQEIFGCSREIFHQEKIFYIDSYTEFMYTLDLAENLFLLKRNNLKKLFINQKAIHMQAKEMLEQYNLPFNGWEKTETLSTVDKVFLNIIRSVDQGAQMLVMNNLSAICNQQDMKKLKELLTQIRKEEVAFLIYDSHPENFTDIVDIVFLVNKGRIEKKLYEKSEFYLCNKIMNETIRNITEITSKIVKKHAEVMEEESYDLSCDFEGKEIQFSIFRGEILYLAIQHGQEQSVLWKSLKSYGNRKELISSGIRFWGEDNLNTEIFPNLSIKDNILLPTVKKINKLGFYKSRERFIFQDREFFEENKFITEKNNFTDSNMLKTIFYRWKLFHPKVLVLNNILSRADVEMKEWILKRLLELTERKTSIILLESAAEDAMKIADRVIMIKSKSTMEDLQG